MDNPQSLSTREALSTILLQLKEKLQHLSHDGVLFFPATTQRPLAQVQLGRESKNLLHLRLCSLVQPRLQVTGVIQPLLQSFLEVLGRWLGPHNLSSYREEQGRFFAEFRLPREEFLRKLCRQQ